MMKGIDEIISVYYQQNLSTSNFQIVIIMKSLFWKKTPVQFTSDKPNTELKSQPGCSLTYLDDLKSMLHFGGIKSPQPTQPAKQVKQQPKKNAFSFKAPTSNTDKSAGLIQTIQLYSLSSGKWNISNCTGKNPTKRINHYCAYEAPNLIIYGGTEKKVLGDMYALNVKTWVWKKLFLLQSPPPRTAGVFISLKDRKYLIGGCKFPESPTNLLGDIWGLSFANVNWDVVANELPGAVWSNVEFTNHGNSFGPLKHFTANPIGDELAYIFGGFATDNEPRNKQYIFNAHTKEIKLIQSKGTKPSPRGKHKMVSIKSSLLLLYGGTAKCDENEKPELQMFIYHVDSATWERPMVGGSFPADLSFMSMCCNTGENESQMIVFGCKQGSDELQQYILASQGNEEYIPKPPEKKAKQATKHHIQEELQQGYKLTQQQRVKIQQLQETLANLKMQNVEMKTRLEHSRDNLPREQPEQQHQNSQLTSKLLDLLLMEQKKRKFLQLKSVILQNTIKDAEKLVVLLDGFSQEEAKSQHINLMKDFRKHMEDIWSKEKALRKQINSKKSGLTFDLSRMFMESLSQQEAKLLSII